MKEIKLKNCGEKTRVLTRREVIVQWQLGLGLDYFCCPNCRDLLYKLSDTDEYYCGNMGCECYYGGEV